MPISSKSFTWPLIAGILAGGLMVAGIVACKRDVGGRTERFSDQAKNDAYTAKPLARPNRGDSDSRFTRLAPSRTGIDVTYSIDQNASQKHLYVAGFACGGVATGDVNGDGLPDVFLAGTSMPNHLFLNQGDFRFKDVAAAAGVASEQNWASTAAMVDIDNDGDLDIYVANYDAANEMFLNDGKGKFHDAARAMGLDLIDASLAPAFCDFDRDGDLDLYLLTNRFYSPTGLPDSQPTVEPQTLSPEQAKYFQIVRGPSGKSELTFVPRADRLLENVSNDHGSSHFVDVSSKAGITSDPGHGLAATWWDYDVDGWPDLYVSNDFDDPDALYHNNQDGTFTDVTSEVLPHTAWFSMGANSADINNDGWPDFFAADMSGTTHYKDKTTMGAMGSRLWVTVTEPRQYMRNALYVGTGTDRMLEAAYLAGVADSDWTWAVKFRDFDCDGLVDLFLTNGMTRNFNNSDIRFKKELFVGKSEWSHYEKLPPRAEQNLAFRNAGDLKFDDVSTAWGLGNVGMSFASAAADFDLDGDPDLIVVNMDEPVAIYRNDSDQNTRISIKLRGQQSNRFGLGTRIEVEAGGMLQTRWLRSGSGFKSSDEPVVHFGLGSQERVDRLTIHWPSGMRQEFSDLAADAVYEIHEEGAVDKSTMSSPSKALFTKTGILDAAKHTEQDFDDFHFQPLLPNKISQLGPATAWGDVDGDGDEDFFIGGACGTAGQLHINMGGGSFVAKRNWSDVNDIGCEDMGCVLFDADGDKDLDLYVVSGGVEAPPNHLMQNDRLYLNDGGGRFKKSRGALPDMKFSGSCVVAADFDLDGDLDLFVGGRVVPAEYPMAPGSRLLLGDGKGHFTDVTMELAPDLANTGMVTGALWTDVNNDNQIDLMVTQEWGPVSFYRNEDGKLVDQTALAGLKDRLGWWNGITGGDFDADGDIDYVVTNFGLNTKYHASKDKPAILYYGDLDGSGKKRIVEAEFESGICYPIRGRSCSTRAIPSLKNKFTSYKAFALAELEEIYAPPRLERATRLEVNTLESGVLINDATGRFRFQPLPRLAQIAPCFGVVAAELDGDGKMDLALAQNFFSPQPETGRMDGGLSLLLKGHGDGTFTPIPANNSGIVVDGDAKSLTVTDFDADGQPDLVFGMNAGSAVAFRNESALRNNFFAVRFSSPVPGTRVTVHAVGAPTQMAEVYFGSGYLSQSSPTLFFGLPDKTAAVKITVRWPGGELAEHDAKIASGHVLTIDH